MFFKDTYCINFQVSLLHYILESHEVQFTSQYLGCYKDRWYPRRAFTGAHEDFDDNNTIETCVNYCGNEGKLCSFITGKTYSFIKSYMLKGKRFY